MGENETERLILLPWSSEYFDDLVRIISPTVPQNAASRRVMEKCGLTYQGLIHWRETECVWYAIDAPEK